MNHHQKYLIRKIMLIIDHPKEILEIHNRQFLLIIDSLISLMVNILAKMIKIIVIKNDMRMIGTIPIMIGDFLNDLE